MKILVNLLQLQSALDYPPPNYLQSLLSTKNFAKDFLHKIKKLENLEQHLAANQVIKIITYS